MYVSYFNKKDFALYNALTYDYHCSLLSGSLAAADSVTYGNNYKSVLNELEYFHVSYGQLPQYATQEKLSAFAYLGRFPR